ncbi:MAG: DUF1285 domain-containing protein [Alphaproteobacteria bacterium]|nr:DUF1285 domain-containing protein [Alphaproteobacteria bacterium]
MAECDVKSNGNSVISLDELLKLVAPDGLDGKLPPVHLWSPERCADIDMEIRKDGSWWHEGGRINRPRLVKLFSRILRGEPDGRFVLVTPYEKVIVHVEDAPFMAVRVDRAGEAGPDQVLVFKTNLDDVVLAGRDAQIRVALDPDSGEPAPYVMVRDGLEAKLTRPVFYELAEWAQANPDDPSRLGVWSQGEFFNLGTAD